MTMKGFTLLEIMIACALVAVLTALAYPSYSENVKDSRRSDAKRSLIEAAQSMERYYSMNSMSYAGATPLQIAGSDKIPRDGSDRYYTLSISAAQNTYTLQAVPSGAQAGDRCGTLTFNRNGTRSAALSTCW